MSRLTPIVLVLAGCLAVPASLAGVVPKPAGAAHAQARHQADLKAHGGNSEMLVLPGLLADRKLRRVELLAEHTGLAGGEFVEFLLVDQSSGHGYEALLWSYAKPSDVHRALEFIGLKPGTPVDPAGLRFWAEGSPLALSVRRDGEPGTFPIGKLILDTATGKTLAEDGFIFTGSFRMPPREGQPAARYAADVREPRSIASIYNEPTTVLDVPGRVSQQEAYGRLVVNPGLPLAGGSLLTIVMTPGDPVARPPSRHFVLSMDRGAGERAGFSFRLAEDGQAPRREASEPRPILEELVALRGEGGAPHVELRFGDRLPVKDVAMTCLLMAKMGSMGMVRIDPPAPGQLYYGAFLADKVWETHRERPRQPWELHLRRDGDTLKAELVRYEPGREEGGGEPGFARSGFDLSAPGELRARLEEQARASRAAGLVPPPPVLLVYAPPGMLYGEIMSFVRPVQDTHRTVFVFIQNGEGK
jgi:hypothetical protein